MFVHIMVEFESWLYADYTESLVFLFLFFWLRSSVHCIGREHLNAGRHFPACSFGIIYISISWRLWVFGAIGLYGHPARIFLLDGIAIRSTEGDDNISSAGSNFTGDGNIHGCQVRSLSEGGGDTNASVIVFTHGREFQFSGPLHMATRHSFSQQARDLKIDMADTRKNYFGEEVAAEGPLLVSNLQCNAGCMANAGQDGSVSIVPSRRDSSRRRRRRSNLSDTQYRGMKGRDGDHG
jgi:hypothetical protein